MASMRSIKRRRESVQSTQQITKAMKLVSTVKLQKARARVEANELYFEILYSTICSILAKTSSLDSKYLQHNDSAGKAVLVMSSNRGLAGGYNSNIVKLVEREGFDKDTTLIYALGRKGLEGLQRKGYKIHKDYSDIINDPLYDDCMMLTKELLKEFEAGNIGEIYVAYTDFKNTVVHDPVLRKLLPVEKNDFKALEIGESAEDQKLLMNYGMETEMQIPVNFGVQMPGGKTPEERVLNLIIPKYMTNIIYGAFLESIASENAARMQAMDSATENADDMISSLSLQYNRARQSSITQELTEIIAGAEALQ
ncbi:MAG: ATP synthase F1 subunit gamma [Lachnospiraceae bacterium]|nr:ATP synthase F1 subunit gamma [Lachnospiraceae bacterium]MBR1675262.1 ATP synthase F1 subunit gamma [Eubacterium sp.]